MTALKAIAVIVAIGLIALLGFVAYAWESRVDPIEPPAAESFDRNQVQRGAELAAIGNCNVCHTAPSGRPFAGGLAIATPFGRLYSTNITPDPETGIGTWSEEAFRRSMREGVDREGHHLYPAFPYDHYTLTNDDDIKAIYAYLMTREPVRSESRENEIRFPFNARILIAGWKLLYFRQGPYQPDTSQRAEWNHGSYLVNGLGHCGACHTPRNALGAEISDQKFAGGELYGWTAYALNQNSPAPVPWDAQALEFYLHNGWHDAHGIARGPMVPVVENLSMAPRDDVRAMATYVAGLAGQPSPERQRRAETLLQNAAKREPAAHPVSADSQTIPGSANDTGAAVYQAACAICHESGRRLPFGGIHLSLSSGPNGPTPQNLINITLAGLPPSTAGRSPIMPGYAGTLSEEQLVALIRHLRSQFSDKPEWPDVATDVRETLSGRRTFQVFPAPTTPAQVTPAHAGMMEKRR
jgi:mono/diheme cytochrome c family protein